MKGGWDGKCEVEVGFGATQTPFETFAVLRLVELKRLLNLKVERGMKGINAIFVFALVFAVFVSASGVASAVPNNPLFFGSPENLSALNIAKVTGTSPSEEYGVKTIRYEIDAAECSIHTVPDAQGYVYLKIADLKPCTKPGEPQLPMKTFVIKLPRDAEVIGAEIVQGNYREIENELNIVPMPQPVPIILPEEKAGERIADTKIYSHETYFPGKAISYDAGSDGKHKIVLLRIYPVQYVPAEKKAILITDAEASVYYSYKKREEGESLFHAATFEVSQEDILNAKNLIITPPELFEHAKELVHFHFHTKRQLPQFTQNQGGGHRHQTM
jgi:hypothetical protein